MRPFKNKLNYNFPYPFDFIIIGLGHFRQHNLILLLLLFREVVLAVGYAFKQCHLNSKIFVSGEVHNFFSHFILLKYLHRKVFGEIQEEQ